MHSLKNTSEISIQIDQNSNECVSDGVADSIAFLVSVIDEMVKRPKGVDLCRDIVLDGICKLIGLEGWAWKRKSVSASVHGLGEAEAAGGSLVAPSLLSCVEGGLKSRQTIERCILEGLRDFQGKGYPTTTLNFLKRKNSKLWKMSHLADSSRETEAGLSLLVFAIGLPRNGMSQLLFFGDARNLKVTKDSIKRFDFLLRSFEWIHLDGWILDEATQAFSAMAPRLREVSCMLAQGYSRKEISIHLRISMNTVHGYVRDIYKFFEVNSHAEFLLLMHTNPQLRRQMGEF